MEHWIKNFFTQKESTKVTVVGILAPKKGSNLAPHRCYYTGHVLLDDKYVTEHWIDAIYLSFYMRH